MKQNWTKIYSGSDLSGETLDVLYLPVLQDGELNRIDVLTDAVQSGNAVFSVMRGGVEVDEITIPNGAKIGSVTGLTVEITTGDAFVLNLVSGNVSAPITLNLVIDTGETGGGTSLPDGDLNGATNVLEKMQGIQLANLNGDVIYLTDNFNDNALDTDLFEVTTQTGGYTFAETNNRLELTPVGNTIGNLSISTKDAFDFSGKKFELDILGVCSQAGSQAVSIAVVSGGDEIDFGAGNGFLVKTSVIMGQVIQETESFVAYPKWRIRELSGNFYQEIYDGTSWITKRIFPAGTFNTAAAKLRIRFLGFGTGNSSTQSFIVDNFVTNIAIGEAEGIPEFGVFVYRGDDEQARFISLADLKSALDALP